MKTKTWPDIGLMPMAVLTICARPSMDFFLMSTASV
jgi:hypothetical protein